MSLEMPKVVQVQPPDPLVFPIVFVGCAVEDLAVARGIQERLEFVAEVEIWDEGTFVPSGQAVRSLLSSAHRADFAVFVLSGLDTMSSRAEVMTAPRDNVIFEAGLFLGVLGLERTFLLVDRASDPKIPSDLTGVTPLTFDRRKQNPASIVGAACSSLERLIDTMGRR